MSVANPYRIRKRVFPSIAIGIVIILAVATVVLRPSQAGNEVPEIVARVNGEAITHGELSRVQVDLLELSRLHGKANDGNPDAEELQRLAVHTLIRRRLMLQEAGRRELVVNGDELDQALTELRGRFDDLESLGAWIQERGLDDMSLLETIRDDILMKRVTAALVAGAEVSEEQVAEYYEAHKEDLIIGEEVRLRIIAVASQTEAENILTALREGQIFGRLARERSIGKLASRGGDTGWVDVMTLPEPLRKVVEGLKPGDASRPVPKNTDEFLIVGLQGRRPLRATSLSQARPEIERRLLSVKQQETLEQWLTKQEKKATTEVFLEPTACGCIPPL